MGERDKESINAKVCVRCKKNVTSYGIWPGDIIQCLECFEKFREAPPKLTQEETPGLRQPQPVSDN